MRTTDPRVPDMLAMRQRGETLQVIGTKYYLTRERVRQLLANTNAPDGAGVYALLAARKAAKVKAQSDAVAVFLEATPGATPDQVAEAVGVGAWEVRAFAKTAGLAGLLREAVIDDDDRPFRYSDEDLLEALRQAAATLPAGVQLTCKAYTAMCLRSGSGPSVPLLFDRFGSWIGACTRAGVVPGSPYRSYEKGFSDDAMLIGLAQFLVVAKSVSVAAYDAWRAGRLIDVACSSAIRKRFGTWVAARGFAQDRMGTPTGYGTAKIAA